MRHATARVRERVSMKGPESGVAVGRDAVYAVSPLDNLLKITT